MKIRPEQAGDEAAIRRVTAAAFADHLHSAGAEPEIIEALRDGGDLTLSLVAELDGAVVGHAAYSPAVLSSGEEGWLTLGPIAVEPGRQGEGIGRALVESGTQHWRDSGGKGVVLLGDPALYSRFGFIRGTPLHIEGELADYFQVLPFTHDIPPASVTFAPAFRLTRMRET
ncbi:MAG TPA: N-acetyltransferase [Croceibacterium sp.]|nr:N-acetyltransferase [Croceibacterium sp.]